MDQQPLLKAVHTVLQDGDVQHGMLNDVVCYSLLNTADMVLYLLEARTMLFIAGSLLLEVLDALIKPIEALEA